MEKTLLLLSYIVFILYCSGVSQSLSTGTSDSLKTIHTAPASSGDSAHPVAAQKTQDVNQASTGTMIRDTVYMVNESQEKPFRERFRNHLDSFKERGYSASGGPAYGFCAVNMKPVKDLIALDPFLYDKQFNFNEKHNYEMVIMSGGYGYMAFGKGIRIGGGGVHGTIQPYAYYKADSIVTLSIETSFGGFLFEKAGSQKKWNYCGGGLLGGGSIQVSALRGKKTFFTNDFETTDANKKKAHFLLLEAHGGVSYSFFPLFHVGLNVSVPAFISPEGFGGFTGDFYTVNPVVVLKILFGNLG
jgi:hypothetical protein